MDKKTILAIVLTVIVITISMFVQSVFFAPETTENTANTTTQTEAQTPVANNATEVKKVDYGAVSKGKNNSSEPFTYETDLYTITFDPSGASISSLIMKEHANADGEHVDLVFRGEGDNNAFLMYWGDDTTTPIVDNFAYTVDGKKVIFTNDYTINGQSFTIVKTYEFKDGEYLFAVTIDIIGDGNFTGLVNNGYAYTLAYEPQVGPAFGQMKNNNYDYRRVYIDTYKNNGKLKKSMAKFNSSGVFTTTDTLQWISVASKYFTVVALPQSGVAYKYTAIQATDGSVAQSDSFYMARPATSSSSSDTVYFYAGPQLKKYLGSYYSGMDNAWGLKNTNLDRAMDSSSALGWLENILKWMLTFLYKIIPNYGIGIILLTLIIKILLYPLTKKGADSTAKMTALQPQMQELQARYKDNPQKLNAATAQLYQENGVSPLGGCLPMLLQFPILIAFYGLLNKHFELRGAMFIPGWIPDLSVPETIATLGFNIPLLGNEIHLLPILYTASMIFSMKLTSNTGAQGGQGQGTMKFMTYGMPIIFFFILYSAPSGLLLYWSVQNILSMIQQVFTNKRVKKQTAAAASSAPVKKEPQAVLKYQEKLKKLEEEKAKAAKANAKNKKK